jgi:hypothetical protein
MSETATAARPKYAMNAGREATREEVRQLCEAVLEGSTPDGVDLAYEILFVVPENA